VPLPTYWEAYSVTFRKLFVYSSALTVSSSAFTLEIDWNIPNVHKVSEDEP
jgi:hypothetical protein